MIPPEEKLNRRLRHTDIKMLSHECCGEAGNELKEKLFSLVVHPSDRVAYNALWVFATLPAKDIEWLRPKRNRLIDCLLHTFHPGKRRLIMTLLEHLPPSIADVRTDYLDFCLTRINSDEPYALRALCLKQSFALCRFYPELMTELLDEIELMQYQNLSPGLRCARKNILRRISALPSSITSPHHL